MTSNGPFVSEVSICNQALTWLGQEPINSLDDDNTTAVWMRQNYPYLRDAVLEERNWTFATVREKSETADRDAWDQMFVHGVPRDWLCVFRVYRDVTTKTMVLLDGWRLEEGKVLADCPTVYMWGIKRVTDTGRFTTMFAQALAARIAADAALPLTENRSLQSDMWNLYDVKLREAAVRDGEQGSNEEIISDSLILARGRHI